MTPAEKIELIQLMMTPVPVVDDEGNPLGHIGPLVKTEDALRVLVGEEGGEGSPLATADPRSTDTQDLRRD